MKALVSYVLHMKPYLKKILLTKLVDKTLKITLLEIKVDKLINNITNYNC